MLKIRDDIDLKELEKYGYIYDEFDGYMGEFEDAHYRKDFNWFNSISIYIKDRCLRACHDETISISDEEVINHGWIDDLIKNGLIEKV